MGCDGAWSKRYFCSGVLLSGVVALAALCGQADRAYAFSFFGLFGDDPPKPSPTTLPYKIDFAAKGDDDVVAALEDSSSFYKLRQDSPPDGASLVQRLGADFAPMLDALWGAGYYNARLTATVGGTELRLDQDHDEAAARTADTYRNQSVVPVTVTAETGPQFKVRRVRRNEK